VCLLFATTSIMTTSSRMAWAFARLVHTTLKNVTRCLTDCRDGGLPFSKFFAQVHPKLELPLNALILTVVLDVIFGCIFLGSNSAFNAILSASVVALGVSYAIPIVINCLRGRKMLGARPFSLPEPIAWAANLVCHTSYHPTIDWYRM
jgi:choline transport protein